MCGMIMERDELVSSGNIEGYVYVWHVSLKIGLSLFSSIFIAYLFFPRDVDLICSIRHFFKHST